MFKGFQTLTQAPNQIALGHNFDQGASAAMLTVDDY